MEDLHGVSRKEEGWALNGHSRCGELGHRNWEGRGRHEGILDCEEPRHWGREAGLLRP